MGTWKYDGFISYSTRADSELADRIQRGLEQLAKPWHRRTALKIFQDVDDLAASPDLSASLRSELQGSNTLVFLASPESAASPWCGDELAYWIAERPPEQLVVALTDGTLVFDREARPPVDFERSTAAPPAFAALTSVPLYVDLRDIGDTGTLDHRTNPEFRARLTKIAAALHTNKTGQPVEPRDIDSLDLAEHRRTKRVRNLAITALTILTIGALLASVIAVLNAREADRQRDEALRQSSNALARLALVQVDEDMAGALDTAAEARSLVRNDTTDTTLLQALWATRPLVWTVEVTSPVTAAVPAGDRAVIGSESGEVAVVTHDGDVATVLEPRDVPVVGMTADPAGRVVAVAWIDGRVALVDAVDGRVDLHAAIEGRPTAVAPYLGDEPMAVVATETELQLVDGSGGRVRLPGDGADTDTRLYVRGDVLTYSDGFAAFEVDLTNGRRREETTGAMRASFDTAAPGVGLWVEPNTTYVGGWPLGAAKEVDEPWGFERRRVPFDDVAIAAGSGHVVVLSGASLDVWERTEYGSAELALAVSGVADATAERRRVEPSADGRVVVTATGSTVQRWEAGRDVVVPDDPPGNAMDAYIALAVGDDDVVWDTQQEPGIWRPARLDLETGEREWADDTELELVQPDSETRSSPDGVLTARLRSGRISVTRDSVPWVEIVPAADVGHLTFSGDGRYLVLASRGGGMEYWPLDVDELCGDLDRRVGPGTAAKAGCSPG